MKVDTGAAVEGGRVAWVCHQPAEKVVQFLETAYLYSMPAVPASKVMEIKDVPVPVASAYAAHVDGDSTCLVGVHRLKLV